MDKQVPVAYRTPEHWLQQAEEASAIADTMHDEQARMAMRAIAKMYEVIARRARARQAAEPILGDEREAG